MKQVICKYIIALSLVGFCRADEVSLPVVGDIHTLTIHVRNHEVHKAITTFLRHDLGLPFVYEPVEFSARLYAGLSGGNLVLEPCGPYANMQYADQEFKAIFYGLNFELNSANAASVAQLRERHISFEGDSTYLSITDAMLAGQNMGVFLSKITGSVKAEQDSTHKLLRAQSGGPLGIELVSEIHIGYVNDDDLIKWRQFLSPIVWKDKDVCFLHNGLELHFSPSAIKEIKGIVFKVTDIEKAQLYLKAHNLLEKIDGNRLLINLEKTQGIRIMLSE